MRPSSDSTGGSKRDQFNQAESDLSAAKEQGSATWEHYARLTDLLRNRDGGTTTAGSAE